MPLNSEELEECTQEIDIIEAALREVRTTRARQREVEVLFEEYTARGMTIVLRESARSHGQIADVAGYKLHGIQDIYEQIAEEITTKCRDVVDEIIGRHAFEATEAYHRKLATICEHPYDGGEKRTPRKVTVRDAPE